MPPPLPWIATGTIEPDHDYVVLASYLPLTRITATPRFLRMVMSVRRQLAGADGLAGWSLYAQPLARHYWVCPGAELPPNWADAQARLDAAAEQP